MNTHYRESSHHIIIHYNTLSMEPDSKIGFYLWQLTQTIQDKLTLYKSSRWTALFCLLFVYSIRIFFLNAYYVVTYCLAIFLLNQFLLFMTPLKADLEDELIDIPVLPVRSHGEFKPFLRKLNEFKLWRNVFLGSFVCSMLTFVQALDIPVFLPVLIMYFCILFVITMRRQIAHMIKHKYIPFDVGKQQYKTKNKN